MRFIGVVLLLGLLSAVKAQPVADTAIYEYKMFITVESLIPAKLGRSRMISTDKNSQLQENEFENFFSPVGINFKNIQNNDVVIVNKMNELAQEGFGIINQFAVFIAATVKVNYCIRQVMDFLLRDIFSGDLL